MSDDEFEFEPLANEGGSLDESYEFDNAPRESNDTPSFTGFSYHAGSNNSSASNTNSGASEQGGAPDQGNAGNQNPETQQKWWDTDEALENLKIERAVHNDPSNEALSRRLFEEAAPAATMSIIHTALHGVNENTRLNAAKYVTERVLGKVGDGNEVAVTPLESLLSDFHSTLEQYANDPNHTHNP